MNTLLVHTLHDLLTYNYWAHRRVWAHILALSEEQFNQPLDYSVGSICEQVVHTMRSEELLLSRIRGVERPTYTAADFAGRSAIRVAWDELEERLWQTVRPMGEAELARPCRYTNSRGDVFEQTVLQLLLQLVNHGTDHRAQTLAMMHTLGAATTAHDLLLFYREANAGV
ncbi:MAG: hypothetical protein GYB64_08545 [Chloroflexi bacterium]|nr:hypothetical protein [Chloroflexota bacterium]